jgi:hypothetical protein
VLDGLISMIKVAVAVLTMLPSRKIIVIMSRMMTEVFPRDTHLPIREGEQPIHHDREPRWRHTIAAHGQVPVPLSGVKAGCHAEARRELILRFGCEVDEV